MCVPGAELAAGIGHGRISGCRCERVTGLGSGQQMWGENKNGRRDWNTDDGTLTLSVPAQIPAEFEAFGGC